MMGPQIPVTLTVLVLPAIAHAGTAPGSPNSGPGTVIECHGTGLFGYGKKYIFGHLAWIVL